MVLLCLKNNKGEWSTMNLEKLRELIQSRGWSEPQFARILQINYSFLYRVLRGERGAGKKFYNGMLRLCQREGLNIYDFIPEK